MRTMMPVVALLSIMAGCASSPTISTGMLGKAKYTIVSPVSWNGDLLILAPGYKLADAPLSASFNAKSVPYKQLLEEGWIVAATSYRRNGRVLREGSEDVELLRQRVVQQFGRPKRTFVVGWSMGAAVATIIAETNGRDYHGVLAIGAALQLRDVTNPYRMTYRPKVPILFLTNQNELKNSSDYVIRAEGSSKPTAIWVVKRDGHCNLTGAEIGQALKALVICARTGKLESNKKLAVTTINQPSVATFKDGRAYGKVMRINTSFGNIYTDFVQGDMEQLGIKLGAHFTLGRAGKSFKVLYGKQFSDVPRGQWIGFITADGQLLIARNLANAAKELDGKEGDEIYIAPLQ